MFTTSKDILQGITTENRVWQGIPSIEVTRKGRVFATWYSGGTGEGPGNYALLVYSDDQVHFSGPIAVALPQDTAHRCYDPCLWIDPLHRLWFTWGYAPDSAVYAVICDDPDADTLHWSAEFTVGYDVMMNKPTVLSTGEWLFPLAVWGEKITAGRNTGRGHTESGSYAVCSLDQGKTFMQSGKCESMNESFDEHMIAELKNGRLMMLIRTMGNLGVSYSDDRGKTWSIGVHSKIPSPSARFHLRRLASGRLLLINHFRFNGRNNLTALLSEDDGKSFPFALLLDERDWVSYPDAKQTEDGFIHICYDRERGDGKACKEDACTCAREILYAKITEQDILAGSLVNPESFTKHIINKLGKYSELAPDLYQK